jgi:hypothetical protein
MLVRRAGSRALPRWRGVPALAGIALVLLACAGSAQAENKVYRWVDSQGNVHYGDMPPDAKKAKRMEVRPPNSAEPPPPSLDAQKLEQCREKIAQIETYRQAARISETDGLGNRREYSDEQKEQLIQRLQTQYAAACGDPPAAPAAPAAGQQAAEPAFETPSETAPEAAPESAPELAPETPPTP